MYKEGEVKSLTFEWNIKEKKWLSNEEELVLWYGHGRIPLENVLKDVYFVSATACGSKQLDKLVLFYVKSNEFPSVNR